MNKLKRFTVCLLTVFALLSASISAQAANGNVTYSGDAGEFLFQPGSEHSLTDLFPDFKDVMPGDTLSQKILVRNNASDKVSVKIYLRALGAHEQSVDFLSQLTLTVSAGDNTMFHAPADQKAQLSEWVALGEFQPGSEVELTVTLQVPVTLDNRFMDAVGYLDWQFMVEEFTAQQPDQPDDPDKPDDPDQPDDPDKPDDPKDPDHTEDSDKTDTPDVPKTGDPVNVKLFTGLFAGSGVLLVTLLWLLLKKKKDKKPDS